MNTLLSLAGAAGVGLKPQHYRDILAAPGAVGFLEIHAENYMGAGGPPHRFLEALATRHPLSIHGVGLSLGSPEAPDPLHLRRLAELVARYRPALVSEHLAWSRQGGGFLNDLLPLPYTSERLAQVAANVDRVQQTLGRRILLENPATYVRYGDSRIPEIDFLTALAERSGCGLLLDVTNVQVSGTNHGFDPAAYLATFPLALVGEIHLAGYATTRDAAGPLLIDAHDSAVPDPVWRLYETVLARGGRRPTLIEWDNELPSWPLLLAQAKAAQRRLDAATEAFDAAA